MDIHEDDRSPGSDDPGSPGEASTIRAPGFDDPIQTIGPYRILQVIGEGGMGTVYLAEQVQPVRRRVALKLIKLGMDTKEVIARFESERQALALMSHPNIAKIHDAGTSPQGRPYFVMEYVKGVPITEYCDEHRLNTRDRLELFTAVCHAIHHAHQKGIIHRDIKPKNVLVEVQDDTPVPKVIDFGVAKAIDHRLTEMTLFTELGQLVGTPEYMSPEQAQMNVLDIDIRTDIYSLGVMLYELLAGALPFEPSVLRSAGYAEIQRIIREVDPPRPSTRLATLGDKSGVIARRRRLDVGTLRRQLHGDLDWIIMRALEKDRTRRYASAIAFAEDIGRHLKHEPVVAGPPGASYRVKKFARRNRGILIATGLVALALVGGIIGSTAGLMQALHARDAEKAARTKAEQETAKATRIQAFLQGMLSSIDPYNDEVQPRDLTVREVLDRAAERVGNELADQPEVEASVRYTIGVTYKSLAHYEEAEKQLRISYDILKGLHGEEDPQTVESFWRLALAVEATGDLARADSLLHELLIVCDRAPDGLLQHKALALHESGLINYKQYNLDEADSLLGRAIALNRRLQGDEGFDLAQSLHLLGAIRATQGRTEESETLLREALAMKRHLYKGDHPDVAECEVDLALALIEEGNLVEADSLARAGVAMTRRTLGDDHPMTASNLSGLAEVASRRGDCETAVDAYREAIRIERAARGGDSNQTIAWLNQLGSNLDTMGDHKGAEARYLEAIDALRKKPSYQSSQLSAFLYNRGKNLVRWSRYPEAEPPLRECLQIRRNDMSEGDWRTLTTQSVLGQALCGQARFAEAEPLLLDSYSGLAANREALPVQDAETTLRDALERVVDLYEAWNRAQPGMGYDRKAASWRAKMEAPTVAAQH